MLILTRKFSETIVVGDDIRVSVLGVKGAQVKLGIEAPKDLTVHREEVYSKVVAERIKAAQEKLDGMEDKNDGK